MSRKKANPLLLRPVNDHRITDLEKPRMFIILLLICKTSSILGPFLSFVVEPKIFLSALAPVPDSFIRYPNN